MSREEWAKNPIHKILKRAKLWTFGKNEIQSVLDVACGLSLKSKFLKPKLIVGVDIYEPYLKAIKADIPYAVIKYDVRKIDKLFLENSFDIVYALDVIEHLKEKDSIKLLNDCKKIARRAVVIETPEGYIPQNLDIQGFEGHKYQTHRSGWSVEKLEGLGFKCIRRPYKMSDVRRHTKIDVHTDINVIDGIYIKE